MSGKMVLNGIEYVGNGGGSGGGNVDDVKVNGVSVVDANKEAQIKSYKEITQAQWEALPSTKLTDGIAYFITDSAGTDGYPPLIYSDEEREIGVWRDGKPLYQKSFVKTGITSSNVGTIATGISFGMAMIVDGYWMISKNNGSTDNKTMLSICQYLNWDNPSLFSWVHTDLDGNITYRLVGYEGDLYVTIQYTKTTDTPGSGKWTTQGTVAHHYSTDEHIIGTWIDGKPLYEKVISNLNYTTSTSWVNTGITIQNLDEIISCKFAQVLDSVIFSFVDYFICKNDGNGNVYAWSTSSNSFTYHMAIIQYTKS